MFKQLLPVMLASALVGPTFAADPTDTIRKAVESKFDVKAEKITKTEYLGLYEIFAEGQILYTDEKASIFFVGNLFDGKTGQNITGKRLFAMLPLDLAVKQVKGSGKATLVTFEDPNCGYCKRLAKDVQKLKDVTVYTFLYPILGEDSVTKTKSIWCAGDRAKAWNDWMINNAKPGEPKKDCTAPIEKLVALGQSFQVTGTPTMLFTDGARVPGAIPLPEIEKKLGELARKGS
jgi:thiol:disulfide interchange protein DsbC